jgi:histone H3/H4
MRHLFMDSKKRNYSNFHIFIHHLLKYCDPRASMTAECTDILNNIISEIALRYIRASVELCRHCKKIVIDSNAIETLTNIWLVKSKVLLDFAHNKWEKYSERKNKKGIRKQNRAGLHIPPARICTVFRNYIGNGQQVGEPAYIFLTAIVEKIIELILREAISLIHIDHKKTINGNYIYRAMNSEHLDYLLPLMDKFFIAGFGNIGNKML